jgi:hypothetical protein
MKAISDVEDGACFCIRRHIVSFVTLKVFFWHSNEYTKSVDTHNYFCTPHHLNELCIAYVIFICLLSQRNVRWLVARMLLKWWIAWFYAQISGTVGPV